MVMLPSFVTVAVNHGLSGLSLYWGCHFNIQAAGAHDERARVVLIIDLYVAYPSGGIYLVYQLVILLAAFLWHQEAPRQFDGLAWGQAIDRPRLVDYSVILEVIVDIDIGQGLASSVADRYDVGNIHSLIDDLRGGLLDLEMVLIMDQYAHIVACAHGDAAGPTGNGGGVVQIVAIIAPGPVARYRDDLLECPGVHALLVIAGWAVAVTIVNHQGC
jgi:hypothetical protein